jgi:hypothetical protein
MEVNGIGKRYNLLRYYKNYSSKRFYIKKPWEQKSLISLTPGAKPIKLFTVVIYELSLEARVFVPHKSFQPSLMFAGKARSLP